jgi:hypothetical protein
MQGFLGKKDCLFLSSPPNPFRPIAVICAYLHTITPICAFSQEKKDCLFFMEGGGGEGRQINPCRQINSRSGQKMKSPVDLGCEGDASRTAVVDSLAAVERGKRPLAPPGLTKKQV